MIRSEIAVLAIIVMICVLAILGINVERELGYRQGCEAAFTDIYNELGVKNIDKDSLEKHCAERYEAAK